ncbi:MAG: competence/damage-inducible protein A [Leptospirillia bacterium]
MTRTEHPPVEDATAAILVIGDEVLAAGVEDINSVFLCRRLCELGVAVRRVVVLPDVIDEIAAEVAACAPRYTHLITTGGVGPTHDDVTMQGVAAGLGVSLFRNPESEAVIRNFYGEDMTEAALAMADLPEGAALIGGPGMRFPVIRVNNVWVFPGSPHLLKTKFNAVSGHFKSTPFVTCALRLNAGEPEIAPFLARVQEDHPRVAIGSYPQEPGQPVRLILTLKSKDADALDATRKALEAGLAEYLEAPVD